MRWNPNWPDANMRAQRFVQLQLSHDLHPEAVLVVAMRPDGRFNAAIRDRCPEGKVWDKFLTGLRIVLGKRKKMILDFSQAEETEWQRVEA